MKLLLVLLIFCSPLLSKAQLQVDKTVFDHGNIASFNNDTAYFVFTNTGIKTIFLLTTQPKEDYAVLCSDKTLLAGASITIGIVYYTDRKGNFQKTIPLYFSHSVNPTEITIKGQIKSIRETAFSTCPSIENSKPLQPSQVPIKITVKDYDTREILTQARVEAGRGNRISNCVPGYESRSYKCNCGYGPLDIVVSKKGYEKNSIQVIYDDKNYDFEVFLKPLKDTIPLPEKPILITETHREKDSLIIPETPAYVPVAYADSGFNSYRYKPNHLIFIIDISGSMKDSSKLYYLKRSMKELTSIIRPGDHFTLITYNNRVRVVFENISGLDKSVIETAIDTLKAGGGSNGSQSIIMAYEIAKKYFITGGNNQIFIATDGLLNGSKMTNEDLYKLAGKGYRQDNVILSSIGFGNDLKAIDFLQKLSRSGRGNFIRIENLSSDVKNLVEEVKKQCRI